MSRITTRGDPSSPVSWHSERPPVKDWAIHKRFDQGDLLAFLSEDGREVEVMEILNMQVYQPPVAASFGNFQTPVIAVAVVLVLGYQYVKNKGKFGGGGSGGGNKRPGKMDWDNADLAGLREKMKAKKMERKAQDGGSKSPSGGLDLG